MPGDRITVPEGHIVNAAQERFTAEAELTAKTPNGEFALPAGHIALMGDFPMQTSTSEQ